MRSFSIFVFAACLTLQSAVAWAGSNEVSVQFVDAVPGRISNGKVTTCNLIAVISNGTKYHIDRITFKVGELDFAIGEMVANAKSERTSISSIYLSDGPDTCAQRAEYLVRNIKSSSVLECTMRGMAEGDCQSMVTISTSLDTNAVAQIRANEDARVAAAKEEIRRKKEAEAAAARAKARQKEEAARKVAEEERKRIAEYHVRCDASNQEGRKIDSACNMQCRGVHAGWPMVECHDACFRASGFKQVSGCLAFCSRIDCGPIFGGNRR